MRLLEETDDGDEETTMMTEKEKEREKGGVEGERWSGRGKNDDDIVFNFFDLIKINKLIFLI